MRLRRAGEAPHDRCGVLTRTQESGIVVIDAECDHRIPILFEVPAVGPRGADEASSICFTQCERKPADDDKSLNADCRMYRGEGMAKMGHTQVHNAPCP